MIFLLNGAGVLSQSIIVSFSAQTESSVHTWYNKLIIELKISNSSGTYFRKFDLSIRRHIRIEWTKHSYLHYLRSKTIARTPKYCYSRTSQKK